MTKTIKITGDIEITEAQAREIANRLKEFDGVEGGYWEPKKDEKYWFINLGKVNSFNFTDHELDIANLLAGNYYRTQDLAQKELDRRIAKQKIKKYIWENGMEWTPDWSDKNQNKYTFRYCHYEKRFLSDVETLRKYSPEKEHFKTVEHRDKFVANCLPELKIVWGV